MVIYQGFVQNMFSDYFSGANFPYTSSSTMITVAIGTSQYGVSALVVLLYSLQYFTEIYVQPGGLTQQLFISLH